MNLTILSGRLTAEPEVRYTTNDEPTAIASYTLAVQRDFKNKDGDYDADFIRCKAFGKRGEWVEKYLHKGTKIIATGRLQTGSYEKDGQTHYTTDLIVSNHEFAERKGEGQQTATDAPAPQSSVVYDASNFTALQDYDIPF